ncbi:MAG TPA: Maf family protein [Longimicrobiales bacterium]|nr:Maf family protein [Longimicrobiales bacterium]
MNPIPRIVLASASPRRADLLRQMGLEAGVRPAHVDESYLAGEGAEAHVERLARMKAEAVSSSEPGALVVGGDTVVVDRGRVLGKPRDREEAVAMLLSLAGRTHTVLTGIALAGPSGTVSAVGRASVHFRAFGPDEARAYAETGEPLDKAGAYGIQGLGAALVDGIDGDYYTVVGFPIGCFIELLARSGWRYAFGNLNPIDS